MIDKLTQTAIMSSKIITHTLQFIKLYFIYLYDNNKPFPSLTKEFIMAVMKTVCEKKSKIGKLSESTKILMEPLNMFFIQYYKPLQVDPPNYICMSQILQYLAIDVLTIFEQISSNIISTMLNDLSM